MYILLASSLPLCVIYVVYDTYILDFFIEDCLFNLYAEYIMRNDGLDEAQAGIKIAKKNINNIIYADDPIMAKSEEELKSLWINMRGE